jgi:hypothetical protein
MDRSEAVSRIEHKGGMVTENNGAYHVSMWRSFGDADIDLLNAIGPREIDLSRSGVTDEGLKGIACLAKLTKVSMRHTGFTGEALRCLPEGDSLEMLDLSDCSRFCEVNLQYLARCPNLRVLKLRDSPVSDTGILRLRLVRSLEVLALEGTFVTDACIRCLAELPKLRSVGFHRTRVSRKGVEELARANPGFVPEILF